MTKKTWEKEGVNYWDNEDCPIDYLRQSLVNLILYVEEVDVPLTRFENLTREQLVERIAFYEHVSDK